MTANHKVMKQYYLKRLVEKQAEIRFLRLQLEAIQNRIYDVLSTEYYHTKRIRAKK